MTTIIGAIIIVMWALWAIYWYVSARNIKKTQFSAQGPLKQILISLMLFLSVFLMLLPALSIGILGMQLIRLKITAVIMCAIGLAFAIWARMMLGENWNRDVVVQKDHELITTGPYSIVRHPIYAGIFLAYLGAASSIGQLRAFIALIIFIIAFSIRMLDEEKIMAMQFPREYPVYQKRVKMIIPFIF